MLQLLVDVKLYLSNKAITSECHALPPPINDHNWRNVKRKKEVYGVGENYSLWFKKQSLGEKL